jgi:hypothetical protein
MREQMRKYEKNIFDNFSGATAHCKTRGLRVRVFDGMGVRSFHGDG